MSNDIERSLDEIIGSDDRTGSSRPSYRHREHSRERPRGPRATTESSYRERGDRYEPPRQTKIQRLSQGKAYLKVTNLHPDITQEDLTSLFATIGPTSFVVIERERGNHHVGYVGYEDKRLNRDAVEKFDGRKAVGQIIVVEEIRPLNVLSVGTANSTPRGPRSRGGRDRDSRRGRREPKKKPTTEDLDKELENYMNNTESTTDSSIAPDRASSNSDVTSTQDLDKELESYMDNKPFPAVN